MKKLNFILVLLIFVLFCSGSCKKEEDKYFITIKNNSDKEIIRIGMVYTPISDYSSIAQDTTCLKLSGKEYDNFILHNMIKPFSSKKDGMDIRVENMQSYPNQVFSIGIFYLEDIETMSCEEFVQKYPLKKEWQVTLEDIMNAPDFNLVLEYTP